MLDTGPEAGIPDVLAWETGGDDVDEWHVLLCDGGQIAEVRGVWKSAGEDGAVVGVPRDVAAERSLHGPVETPIASAERADTKVGQGFSLFA